MSCESKENFMFEIKRLLPVNFRVLNLAVIVALLVISCQAQQKTKVSPPNNQPLATPSPFPVSHASEFKFSSAYTRLDSKTCKPLGDPKSTQDDVPYICTGYGGYKIFVSTHGVATRIYIGREITENADSWDASTLPSFIANNATAGQVIEWRLANRVPFACIVRAQYDRQIFEPGKKGEENSLVVKSLKGFAPIEVLIDAQKNKRANEEARRAADAGFRKL
jgi:hypothetical protein